MRPIRLAELILPGHNLLLHVRSQRYIGWRGRTKWRISTQHYVDDDTQRPHVTTLKKQQEDEYFNDMSGRDKSHSLGGIHVRIFLDQNQSHGRTFSREIVKIVGT